MSQDIHASDNTNLGWDPDNPHGNNPHTGDSHGGHFVADYRMQVSILVILLTLTLVTVGFYNLEQWVEVSFDILLPKWVNIAGVMTIAVIKAILVAAFFMQLKYDKVLNTFVILFCLFCVALFLGFVMIDLDDRGLVDPAKQGEIQAGGTGVGLNAAPKDPRFSLDIAPRINTAGMSVVQYARLHGNEEHPGLNEYRENTDMDEADFWTEFYGSHATHRDELDESNYFESLGFEHKEAVSSANASHPRHGITPGLLSDVEPSGTHPAGGGHAIESHENGE